MLEADKLEGCLLTIRSKNLNIMKSKSFAAMIFHLSNSSQVSLGIDVHGAEEILRVTSVVLDRLN